MRIEINAKELTKILQDKFGEAEFKLNLFENHDLLCKMWKRNESDMKTPALRKGRIASFDGFSAYLSLVDKRIDPARYSCSDISKDEKAINDEVNNEQPESMHRN